MRTTRFADPVWKDSATWGHHQGNLFKVHAPSRGHVLRDSGAVRQGAPPACRVLVPQVAERDGPEQFLLTNPVAMRKFVDSKGEACATVSST